MNDRPSMTLVDRKRKRRGSLQVRFCPEPCEIIETYSQADYDRGGLFPDEHQQPLTTFNKNIVLTLSFGFMASPPPPAPPIVSLPKKLKTDNKKRPKLSIDTSKIHDGPLYFTSMTTNHQNHQKREQQQVYREDDRITMENTEINRRCLVAAV